MYEDRLTHIHVEAELRSLIARLACCWLQNHSSNYTPMDGPAPRWDRLLKRVYLPPMQEKPVQPDKFFPPMRGGNLTPWLLCRQMIGPYTHSPEVDSLEEYWQLWGEGLALADAYRAMTGRHPANLPWLWSLEAPPPHLL